LWSKSPHDNNNTLATSDIKILCRNLNLKQSDIIHLYKYHRELLLSELKYYKSINVSNR
jgi:hypothetical protein